MYGTGYYATGYYATGYYLRGPAGPLFGERWSYYTLILEAREVMGDTEEDCQRYPDAMLINALNRGLQELGRIRPDAYYDLFDVNSLQVPEVTDLAPGVDQVFWGAEFPLDTKFYPALVYYVVGSTELSEDEYVQGGARHPWDSRAAGSLRLFRKHVLSV